MVCIYCSGSTRVTNSRPQKRQNAIWRRRNCDTCGALFTTTEQADLASSLLVKHPGGLAPFDRDKLFISVYEACRHRATALTDASALCGTITNAILRQHTEKSGLIDRSVIVAIVIGILQRFDTAAATMYTAYHK